VPPAIIAADTVVNLPSSYKKKIRFSATATGLQAALRTQGLHTVCEAAQCPNRQECLGQGVAAFMILGDCCTRACAFCAVNRGLPGAIDPDEPRRVATMVAQQKLRHVVVTSVTRDDLLDGGAGHFNSTIGSIRAVCPGTSIEVLIPDFNGNDESLLTVVQAAPAVLNHNLETVPHLYSRVRPQADYKRSLRLLGRAREMGPGLVTKSGLMVGLGEDRAMVLEVMRDLRNAGCDILTIGQYFQPQRTCLPVERYVEDGEFKEYEQEGRRMGFKTVAAGRFVRSSYHAQEVFRAITTKYTNDTNNKNGANRTQ
jgi:lipoic acid synthetase